MKNLPFVVVSLVALLSAAPVLADDNINTSHIDQIGTNLSATATQTGEGNTSDANIDQGLGVAGDLLVATINQHGIDNIQDGQIIQDGTSQMATIDQHGDGSTNHALVDQDGTNNLANILQNGTGNTNSVEIFQTGTGLLNIATVNQGGQNSSNTAGVTQIGGNLTATITQN